VCRRAGRRPENETIAGPAAKLTDHGIDEAETVAGIDQDGIVERQTVFSPIGTLDDEDEHNKLLGELTH
jgi:hypothetical protein